ncbi:MAG: STAS domain-containing protein [bacterium]|nr:STAS domain-containing protein [bacterium]
MDITVEENGIPVVIGLAGIITMRDAGFLKDRLFEIGEEINNDIEIDLSDLTFIDSSGLGALITFYRFQNQKKKRFIISKINPKVKTVFDCTKLSELFAE